MIFKVLVRSAWDTISVLNKYSPSKYMGVFLARYELSSPDTKNILLLLQTLLCFGVLNQTSVKKLHANKVNQMFIF